MPPRRFPFTLRGPEEFVTHEMARHADDAARVQANVHERADSGARLPRFCAMDFSNE